MKSFSRNFTQYLILTAAVLEFAAAVPHWYITKEGAKYFIDADQIYNWLQASDDCARRGLQLATIDTAKKNTALVILLKATFGDVRNLWIGAHDELSTKTDTKRPFYWLSTGQNLTFANWGQGEPNNMLGNEHCVHTAVNQANPDFVWNDAFCDELYGYICELKRVK